MIFKRKVWFGLFKLTTYQLVNVLMSYPTQHSSNLVKCHKSLPPQNGGDCMCVVHDCVVPLLTALPDIITEWDISLCLNSCLSAVGRKTKLEMPESL